MQLNWLTWAMLITLGGLLALVVVQLTGFVSKGKTRKVWTWISVGLLVAGGIPALGIYDYGFSALNNKVSFTGSTLAVGGEGEPQPVPTPDITGCNLGDPVTVTVSGIDKYTQSASGGTHRYKLGGGVYTTIADASTFTGSPYKSLYVLFGNASTTGEFSTPKTFTLPCESVFTASAEMIDNSTITTYEYETDDTDDIDGLTENITIGADETKTAIVKLTSTKKSEFTYGFLAVVDFNKVAFDSAVPMDMSGNLHPTAQGYNLYDLIGSANSTTKWFVLPPLIGGQDLLYKIDFESDTAVNPGPAGPQNATIRYYPINYYIDETAGGIEKLGAIDEDGALTRPSAGTSVIFFQ